VAAPLHVIVEIPMGSRNNYEWDAELDAIKLDRFLFASVTHPTGYGFFPDTLAEDGDPLDAMVCVSDATFPCCDVPVRPIALSRMRDDTGVDDAERHRERVK
jgi:inorganic pyrophosphatase